MCIDTHTHLGGFDTLICIESVSIRQHTSAYVSIRQHTSAYVSIRQHTTAYDTLIFIESVNVRMLTYADELCVVCVCVCVRVILSRDGSTETLTGLIPLYSSIVEVALNFWCRCVCARARVSECMCVCVLSD